MVREHRTGLQHVVQSLQLCDVPQMWYDTWDVSETSFPPDGLEFLREDIILRIGEVASLPQDAVQALLRCVQTMQNDDALSLLAWHCHRLLYSSPQYVNPWTFYMPRFERECDKELSGLFLTLVTMSGFGTLMRSYVLRGIPYHIMSDTLGDLRLWMHHYYEEHGFWGLENLWLYLHFSGRLFRVGRLQYALERFGWGIRVYQKKGSDELVVFSEPQVRYRSDGQIDGTANIVDPDGGWLATLSVDEDNISGYPISPYGRAMNQRVSLPSAEWQLVLSKGDLVLDMHIPEGEKLSGDLCKDSMEQADLFFQKYFPEFNYQALTCSTWLFDVQFQRILSKESNIVHFQRQFHLFPIPSTGESALYRVFGIKPGSGAELPTEAKLTRLQRAITQHLRSGGHLRDAGGFILKRHLDWGQERYQRSWDLQHGTQLPEV